MTCVRVSALAGLLSGDHWPRFDDSTVAGLLGGLCSLGVLAVVGLFVGGGHYILG